MGGQFVFGKGEGIHVWEQNHERKGDARRPVSISYREKLLSPGGLGFLVSHEEADDIVSGWKGFFAKKHAESEMYEGEDGGTDREEDKEVASDSKYPVLSVTSEQYTTWCKPWMNSLIIKVLGWSVPKHVLMDRVRRMWKPKQSLKVVPLSNEYYIVSFSSKEDRDYAYYEGPWMINDHYLLVQRWRPNFNPGRADCQRKVAVWIRILDLPLEFCTVESLEIIGNMIGKIIKIDRSTSIYDKGGFARICVEVDLLKPLLPAFTVFGEDKQLVYEGLHLVCFNCGRYGHAQEQCADRIDELHKTPINVKNMKERVVDVEIRKGSQVTEVEATATVAGGRNHLGPQMVFHRNMRRLPPRVAGSKDEAWSEGGAKIGGGFHGSPAKTQDVRRNEGDMARLKEAEILRQDRVRSGGSKRKKDDGPKGFGKENKPRPKPKPKAKPKVNHEANGVEMLNAFTVLQAPIPIDNNQCSVGPSEVNNKELPCTPTTMQHAEGNIVVEDVDLVCSNVGPADGIVKKNDMVNYLGNGLGPTPANQF
ncbi:hypothetical protein K1719_018782 [Acacia pycnantha]|nr:hypothetical protein K1719_018782 [Acacia pycnantha]